MTHAVIYGQGAQTLRHVPYDRHGRPTRITSATYAIVDMRHGRDSADRTIVAETAATLGSETEATTADAGRSTAYPTRIAVADTSGFVEGRRYLLEDDDQRELVEIASIETNTYLHTLRAIRGDYPSGSTIHAIELEGEFPASEVNDEDETVEDGTARYQIAWEYTIDDRVYLVPEMIVVRRYATAPWIGVDDILRGDRSLAKRADPGSIADALAIATDDTEADLEVGGKDPSTYRPSRSGQRLVRARALMYVYGQFHGDDDQTREARYAQEYQRLLGHVLAGPDRGSTIVRDDDDMPDAIEPQISKLFARA